MKTLQAILLLFASSLLVDFTDCFFPGGRYGASVWNVPDSNDLYLYGGYGIGAQPGLEGRLNDMWLYDYSANSWEWLGGAQVDQAPSFGEKGTAGETNTPGGLKFACPFMTDTGLWLFGGSTQDDIFMNALWNYSKADNQWAWISGSQAPNPAGFYVELGTATPNGILGGREGASCFSGPKGNFFGVFGGNGVGDNEAATGYLNDMWIYLVDINRWAWAGGNTTVNIVNVPVAKGVPSRDTYPSGTYNAGSWAYSPNSNETYLYFGFGNVKTTSALTDEVWRFELETFEWTVLKSNEVDSSAISSRTGPAVWGSFSESRSWIFGGYGIDEQGNQDYLGDLHFYFADTNAYSTMSKAPKKNGNYGEKGVADPNNYPGSRAYAATWKDSDGNLWLFGGFGYDGTNGNAGNLNDVWKFDVKTNMWTWMSGSQTINAATEYNVATPEAAPIPDQTPEAEPLSDQTPTAPKPQSVGGAPQAAAGELTAEQQIGIGVGVGVGGPVVAGAIILAVLLQKRKADNKRNSKTASDVEANNNTEKTDNNTGSAETGNYKVIPAPNTDTNYGQINAVALDPIVPTSGAKISGADNRLIPYTSVTLEKEIGVGSYGKVYLGKLRTTKVAIKVANTKISQEEFIREANFQLAIPPHPNIVQLLGISIDGPEPLVVLEYCNEGSLDKLLFESDKIWTIAEQINLAAAIARGLDHLHQNNIVHRDLAVRNILLHHNEPKISDFGMSRKLKETAQVGKTATNIGPIRWMAPEALGKQSYSTKSDVWTFGILLYEIVAKQEPHAEEDLITVAVKIRDTGYTPTIPEGCPELLSEIMQMCWKVDPAERPDMSFICEKLDIK